VGRRWHLDWDGCGLGLGLGRISALDSAHRRYRERHSRLAGGYGRAS
jgi:hypothetical protein